MALAPCASRTDQQNRELVQHGSPLFPIACYQNNPAEDAVPWHWHVEMEFAVMAAGEAVIAAGTDRFTAAQGEGFFINSGVLHAAWEQGRSGCRIHSAVFHPRLVGGSLDSVFWSNYVQPLMDAPAQKALHFDGSEAWHSEAIALIESAWTYCAQEPVGYEFRIRSALSELLLLLSIHRPAAAHPPSKKLLRDEERIKAMLGYIQAHYASPLNTAAIARSAAISESECVRCFQSVIGTPPIQYLKQFRIQRAAGLLASTDLGVAEIGALCGFEDASYFSKSFREAKGYTPSRYRESLRAGAQP